MGGLWQWYPLHTGHLLIFPAWLEHRVEQFEGPGERISIAFNATNGAL